MKVFGTDYDGVIINIEPQKASAFGELLNKEWGVNKDEASKFWIETGGTSRRYKFYYFYDKQFGMKLKDKVYKVVESKYSNLLRTQYYSRLKLLPGALELLSYVRGNFDFTFVSSGVPMEEIKYLVNLNGVSKYFDSILGTDNVYKSKHEHFRKIKEQNPEVFVFIADGLEDMRVTKEFGATSIGVTTNHSKAELSEAGATKTCDDLFEALSLLRSLARD